MGPAFPAYRRVMDARFEDAWDALDDCAQSALLEERHSDRVSPEAAAILLRTGLVVLGGGFGRPGAAPVHWPPGLRDFLADKAAIFSGDEDLECE